MAYVINEEKIFSSGHNGCPGCNEALAIRYVLNSLGSNTVAVVPPSCISIISGAQPYSSMRIPTYQCAFETSAISAAGIKRALNARGKETVNVVAIAGDGGTYDIGFQALSAAAERNEDIIYVCLDNEGYMNTGTQKSSATPYMAYTTSTPSGKLTPKKNLALIMAEHKIPYVATATTGYPDDLVAKILKAKEMSGLRFILVLTPCLDGWGLADNQGVKISRLAVESGVFPLYEVKDGDKYTLNHGPNGIPVSTYLSKQKRYKHLDQNDIAIIQSQVDQDWRYLKQRFVPALE